MELENIISDTEMDIKKDAKTRKKSIKTRLLIIPIIFIIVSIGALGWISSIIVKSALYSEMEKGTIALIEQIIVRMEDNSNFLNYVNEEIINEIKYAIRVVKETKDDLSNEKLIEIADTLGINEINYYNDEGILIHSNIRANLNSKPEPDNPISMFIRGSEKELMEDIRQDPISFDYLKYGAVKNPDGSVIQVGVNANQVISLMDKFSYQNIMENLVKDGNILHAYFVDNNLKVVAHSDEDSVGIDLSEDEPSISAVIDKKLFATKSVDSDGRSNYNIIYPVDVHGKHMGAINMGLSMENVQIAISQNIKIIILTGMGIVLFLGFILYFTSNYTIQTIFKLKEQMNSMASGDFTLNDSDKIKTRDDEFGDIINAVAGMKSSIRSVLENILDKSQSLSIYSKELNATTQQSAQSAEEIARAIEGIAKGSSEQASDAEKGFNAVQELDKILGNNSAYLEDLVNSTLKVNNLKEEGLDLIGELIDLTKVSTNATKNIQEVINEANDSAIVIETVAKKIKNIANQTNLLALNASIEAARAGETGKGFAVVADEVRKLAEDSNRFAEEIGEITDSLTSKTSMAVETMNNVGKIIENQEASVYSTSDKFNGIAIAMNEMEDSMSIVRESGNEMNKQNVAINKIIQNLATLTQENAANSEEVSASMEQQTATVSQISNVSQELAGISRELNELIDKFKV